MDFDVNYFFLRILKVKASVADPVHFFRIRISKYRPVTGPGDPKRPDPTGSGSATLVKTPRFRRVSPGDKDRVHFISLVYCFLIVGQKLISDGSRREGRKCTLLYL